MLEKKFQRKREDFACEHCGLFIQGTGYTDHCPKCLWSKHVDVNPGDRKEKCGGLMKPTGIEAKDNSYVIYYQCVRCGHNHKVRSVPEDDFEEILKLIKETC